LNRFLSLGAGGAAAATAIAQTSALGPLLYILQKRVKLSIRGHWQDFSDSLEKKYWCWIIHHDTNSGENCRQSALLGSVVARAYSVTFQIVFFIKLVCESITVAV
jgi:Na+-driven multidrug efflux pump